MEESSMASAAESHIPMEFSSNVKKLLGAYIPLELQLLSALVTLLLFLFLLISILWDQYGKEIGELYSSPMGTVVQGKKTSDVKVDNDADEFSIYQKLPTFFYEYMPRQKKE